MTKLSSDGCRWCRMGIAWDPTSGYKIKERKTYNSLIILHIFMYMGKLNASWCSKSLEVMELILEGAQCFRSGLCFYAATPSAFGGQHRLGLAGLTIHSCFTNIGHGWKRTTWWWWWWIITEVHKVMMTKAWYASIISHFSTPSVWLQICYSYNLHVTILHNFDPLWWRVVSSVKFQTGFRGILGT